VEISANGSHFIPVGTVTGAKSSASCASPTSPRMRINLAVPGQVSTLSGRWAHYARSKR
jgi:hypothetical protein